MTFPDTPQPVPPAPQPPVPRPFVLGVDAPTPAIIPALDLYVAKWRLVCALTEAPGTPFTGRLKIAAWQ